MTSETEKARLLAERIARRVSASGREQAASSPSAQRSNEADLGAELSAMRAGLDDLRQKLVQIESRLKHDAQYESRAVTASTSSTHAAHPALRLSGMYVPTPHPSEERFGVEEATVAELVDYFEGTKKCDLEPGDKPCDHCAMCSSRGF